jgi:acetyl-CoA C-acetyltransferase
MDDVIWGTSAQKGLQGGDMGRMAALDAGFDTRVSGVTLDRFCGSGITATSLAAAQIKSGMEDLVIAGGTEMMSLRQRLWSGAARCRPEKPGRSRHRQRRGCRKRHPQSNQGVCADAIASLEGISRETLDAFGLKASARGARRSEGRFDRSTVPVVDDDGKSSWTKRNIRAPTPRPKGSGGAEAELRADRRHAVRAEGAPRSAN